MFDTRVDAFLLLFRDDRLLWSYLLFLSHTGVVTGPVSDAHDFITNRIYKSFNVFEYERNWIRFCAKTSKRITVSKISILISRLSDDIFLVVWYVIRNPKFRERIISHRSSVDFRLLYTGFSKIKTIFW